MVLTGGTPSTMECTPSFETIRIVPLNSVTSILPSGRNATDHGVASPVVTVSTANAVCDLRAGASVWPGNAGLGFSTLSGVCSSAVKLLGGDLAGAASAGA